jgi:hypothetical protein
MFRASCVNLFDCVLFDNVFIRSNFFVDNVIIVDNDVFVDCIFIRSNVLVDDSVFVDRNVFIDNNVCIFDDNVLIDNNILIVDNDVRLFRIRFLRRRIRREKIFQLQLKYSIKISRLSIRELRELYKFVFSSKKRFRIVDFVFLKYVFENRFFFVEIQSNLNQFAALNNNDLKISCLVRLNRCSTTRFVIFSAFARKYLIAHLRIARIVWKEKRLKFLLTLSFHSINIACTTSCLSLTKSRVWRISETISE